MINPIVTIARRSARIVVQLQAVCFGRIGAVSFEVRGNLLCGGRECEANVHSALFVVEALAHS